MKINSGDVRFCFRTKQGKKIKVFEGTQPLLPQRARAIRKEHQRQLGGDCEERALPNTTYNCHGLTFINKLGFIGTAQRERKSIIIPGQQECFHDEEGGQKDLEDILKGNGFKEKINIPNIKVDMDRITPDVNIYPGDVVLYLKDRKFTHSCSIYDIKFNARHVKIKVLSKLGDIGGEHFHCIDNDFIIQQYGNHIQIWSDSKRKDE